MGWGREEKEVEKVREENREGTLLRVHSPESGLGYFLREQSPRGPTCPSCPCSLFTPPPTLYYCSLP